MMESALTARDRVGVQDFVLLENYTSEAAFIENLRKRFKENLIYVSGNLKRLLRSGWAPGHAGRIFLESNSSLWSLLFRTFASSLHPDVHRVGAGVGEPLQRPGDLHQGPHGAVPGSEFLRGLPTHVRSKALLSSATSSSGVNESCEGAAELICQVLG